ncbi:MAG TPA: hypothetical protein V6C58_23665 [Allocoleopsis sp.]
MNISDFTGRIKVINFDREKTVLVVKEGYLIEKIYNSSIDSYRVGDLPPRSDTVSYMSHSDPDYCDTMIAYDCDKNGITTITYPSPESLYSDSQYEISCHLQDDTESIEIMTDSGEVIKLEVGDFWINDDLDQILGIDRIDTQTIGRDYFNEYSSLFRSIAGYELEYEGLSLNRNIMFSMKNARDLESLSKTSQMFKTKFPDIKFDLYYEHDGGSQNFWEFILF